MIEQELWHNIVHDPSSEEQHQKYANACVDNDCEKEALQRYATLRNTYPAIADKFTKQLTVALEFKLMPDAQAEGQRIANNSIIGRMGTAVHSLLLTGIITFGYGLVKKSSLELVIGVAMVVAYLGFIMNRPGRFTR